MKQNYHLNIVWRGFESKANSESECLKGKGNCDHWESWKHNIMPKNDQMLNGFVSKCFSLMTTVMEYLTSIGATVLFLQHPNEISSLLTGARIILYQAIPRDQEKSC